MNRRTPSRDVHRADEIGLDRSGVTRRASRLEEAGLLRREFDPRDQRATLLVLTKAGESAVEVMCRRLAAHLQAHFDQWPPAKPKPSRTPCTASSPSG